MRAHLRVAATAILAVASIGLIWILVQTPADKSASTDKLTYGISWEHSGPQKYQLSMDSSMSMSTAGSGPQQDIRVKMKSSLIVSPLTSEPESTVVGMQLSELELRISGQSDPEMNRMLEKPFRVKFSKAGAPQGFEYSAGLNAQEHSMLENIVRTFTVSIVENTDAWISNERSASGTYEASYQREDSHQIIKAKSNFAASQSAPILHGAEINSTEIIELDSGKNWIAQMTVDETLESPGSNGPAIRISNRASLELMRDARLSIAKDHWKFAASQPQREGSSSNSTTVQMPPEHARRKLIAGLSTLDATEQRRSTVIHELRDLLRMDGSLPKTLLEQMKTQELSDRTRADLYLVLELAATVEAQAALTEVITQSEWSTRDAMRATVALAGINDPSPETLAVLWSTAYAERGQLSTTATYSLGSVGSRMKAASNPDYAALRDGLLNQAYSTGDVGQRASFIYSLGNTRDAEIAPDVGTFLDDEHPSIRRAAALSLGLMQSDYSASALIARFEQENNSQVRGAIAESLIRVPIADSSPVMASINSAIQTEADESARYAMANFLATNLKRHPQYESNLRKLMRREPSKRIRQAIGNALATQ